MNAKKLFCAAFALFSFSTLGNVSKAQSVNTVTPSPVAYTTAPKAVVAKLKKANQAESEIKGALSFRFTRASLDDAIEGTVLFSLSDEARQKIAVYTEKSVADVPALVSQAGILARFEEGTAPPTIHLLLNPVELNLLGAVINLELTTLDIKARQNSHTVYTDEEVEALITGWARQIQAARPRRGFIARLNRALAGEP